MTTLVVVSDLVAGLRPDPVRDLAILSSLLGELLLNEESLVGRLLGTNEAEQRENFALGNRAFLAPLSSCMWGFGLLRMMPLTYHF